MCVCVCLCVVVVVVVVVVARLNLINIQTLIGGTFSPHFFIDIERSFIDVCV